MRRFFAAISSSIVLISANTPVSAASLQVTPVSIEVPAPGAAATVTLNNPSDSPLKAQVRVFKWSLVNGEEHLEPTAEVVASPPMATLQPKADYTVRLVRLSKQPAAAEETYRLMVDEIPEASKRTGIFIKMAFRYSIPVFFTPAAKTEAALSWSVERRDGKLHVSATNTGNRRVRLAGLKISDGNGKSAVIANGLAGYVLARSSKSWVAPDAVISAGTPLLVEASGDQGPINAQAILKDDH